MRAFISCHKMLSVGKCWVPHSCQEEDEKQVASDDEQAMRMSLGCWTFSVPPMRAFISCHKMLSVGKSWVPHSCQEEDEKQVASDDEQAMRMSLGCWTFSVPPHAGFH